MKGKPTPLGMERMVGGDRAVDSMCVCRGLTCKVAPAPIAFEVERKYLISYVDNK